MATVSKYRYLITDGDVVIGTNDSNKAGDVVQQLSITGYPLVIDVLDFNDIVDADTFLEDLKID